MSAVNMHICHYAAGGTCHSEPDWSTCTVSVRDDLPRWRALGYETVTHGDRTYVLLPTWFYEIVRVLRHEHADPLQSILSRLEATPKLMAAAYAAWSSDNTHVAIELLIGS